MSAFFLIANTCILLACTKSNSNQMPLHTPDSTNITTDTSTFIKDTSVKTYLALGDSYTIGESVPTSERYPVQTVGILNASKLNFQQPDIIAKTGWTTADLQNAINNYHFTKSSYAIVTLLIGVNNQYHGRTQSEYKEQFTELLIKSIALAGGKASHVVVLSIPDYSVTPFAGWRADKTLIASEIDSFNMINKQISGDYQVNYIDITGESRKAATDLSLIASDGLHYSGKEYTIWATLLAQQIEKILR